MLIDMDYFFVACEEIKRPELVGKPTIVGAEPKEGRGRGVVMTCNYAARKFGIHSGMPISQAYKLRPDANFLPVDYSYYEKKSEEAMAVIRGYSPALEQVSIDEAFIDVSEKAGDYDTAVIFAERIKHAIREKAKLPCSIGVSTNKLMAKIASDFAKPNGVKLVRGEDARDFIKDFKTDALYGVGSKTKEKLDAMGYDTVGKLARANISELVDKFGAFGIDLHNYANGIDESQVVENNVVKSIGREKTFERDTSEAKLITDSITELAKDVGADAKRRGVSFKTVTLKMRYSDFSEQLRSRTVRPTDSAEEIASNAILLYDTYHEKGRKVRKLGVKVSGLIDYKSQKRLGDYFS